MPAIRREFVGPCQPMFGREVSKSRDSLRLCARHAFSARGGSVRHLPSCPVSGLLPGIRLPRCGIIAPGRMGHTVLLTAAASPISTVPRPINHAPSGTRDHCHPARSGLRPRTPDADTDVDATMLVPTAARGVLNGADWIDNASPKETTSTAMIAARVNTRYRFRIPCSHRGSPGREFPRRRNKLQVVCHGDTTRTARNGQGRRRKRWNDFSQSKTSVDREHVTLDPVTDTSPATASIGARVRLARTGAAGADR